MLMFRHRGDAHQISRFPIPALTIVSVVTAPFDDENLLLSHMPVFAGTAARWNLLHVEPDSSRRAVDLGMGKPFQPSLRAPFPRLLFVSDHVSHRVAENALVMKQLQIAIVGIFDRPIPR